ncbi:(S)-norcoclaurine synthase [Bertholletia excelsa]
MFGTVSEEMQVNVPANQAWKLYGTLQLAKLVGEKLPNVIERIDLVEGDGGVGTVLNIALAPAPGSGGSSSSYKEKFTKIDEEKRVKETEVIEGGYLELGFTLYRIRFEIIETGKDSCISRCTIEYDVKEEAATNASLVSIQPLLLVMETAANHLLNLGPTPSNEN